MFQMNRNLELLLVCSGTTPEKNPPFKCRPERSIYSRSVSFYLQALTVKMLTRELSLRAEQISSTWAFCGSFNSRGVELQISFRGFPCWLIDNEKRMSGKKLRRGWNVKYWSALWWQPLKRSFLQKRNINQVAQLNYLGGVKNFLAFKVKTLFVELCRGIETLQSNWYRN
jgi:hypothetical protein